MGQVIIYDELRLHDDVPVIVEASAKIKTHVDGEDKRTHPRVQHARRWLEPRSEDSEQTTELGGRSQPDQSPHKHCELPRKRVHLNQTDW